jgi:glycosyltransferase involved in cell wall biosynthesis
MTSVHSALDGRIYYKECRSLARAGFHVTIVGPHSTDAIADDVNIKSIPRDRSRLARMTRTVWRVYQEAVRQAADVYHFHDPELIPAALLLRAKGKRVIYDVHEDVPKDIMSKFYLPSWSRSLIAWIALQIERAACRRFSALVTVTPAIAERLRTINKRTEVVHNYPYAREIVFAHKASPWEARRQSVAYTGGISAQRGLREMVTAMSLLPPSLRASLELAGNETPEDIDPNEIYEHVGWARVKHHGLLNQHNTFRLLHRVRAGLVLYHPEPNHLESLPQKIFEYMGAGLPVIASDFPLWRKLLSKIGCALFVDPLKPQAIAQAIEFILANPAEAEDMGLRGQLAVLDQYNWDTEAKKLVDLYLSLMSSSCAA